ncbi:MAG: type IV pilus biogenesis/stability protein PilW [Candidatus Eutrophobiaceae bacterium]
MISSMRVVALLLLATLSAACGFLSNNKEGGESALSVERQALAYRQLGQGYMRDGQYKRALEAFERARDVLPDGPEAYTLLGVLYGHLNFAKKAEQHFREALDLAPDDPSILNNYGRFLCNEKRHREGIELLLIAAKNPLYERSGIAWMNAGLCSLNVGQPAQARQYFEWALEADPTMLPALLQLSDLSLASGDISTAQNFLQRYQNVAPHNASSLWLGARIKHRLGDRGKMARYGRLLLENFPSSKEALQYQSLMK